MCSAGHATKVSVKIGSVSVANRHIRYIDDLQGTLANLRESRLGFRGLNNLITYQVDPVLNRAMS
jgi:hypothetical protein